MNQRIDYFAHIDESPLYPKILRHPSMRINNPGVVITAVFVAASCLATIAAIFLAAKVRSPKSFSCNTAMHLVGLLAVAASLYGHLVAFFGDPVYSVNNTLLRTAVGVLGVLVMLL